MDNSVLRNDRSEIGRRGLHVSCTYMSCWPKKLPTSFKDSDLRLPTTPVIAASKDWVLEFFFGTSHRPSFGRECIMYLFMKISIHINQRTGMTGVWKSNRTAENISRHLYIYIYTYQIMILMARWNLINKLLQIWLDMVWFESKCFNFHLRTGIASFFAAGLFFHDTGRHALESVASSLLQRTVFCWKIFRDGHGVDVNMSNLQNCWDRVFGKAFPKNV